MSARLLALNLFMAGLSVFFFITIVHTRLAPDSRTASRAGRASAVTASPKHDVAVPGSPLGRAYDVIATRNLFDPNRSDAKNLAAIVETLPPAAALALYGVVISEDTRLAYLEDPATKRIIGYKIGDQLAGGQVQRIEPDRVVIMRAGGLIEVRLHDPDKPRPVVSESPQAQGTNEGRRRRPAHD
jgi:type II secretory pathway component PulC